MFNLLPEDQKKITFKDYKLRFFTLALFFLGLAGVLAFVILSPSFLAVTFKHESLVERQEKLQKENPALLNIAELESEVKSQKNRIKVVTSSKYTESVSIIENILSNLGSKILITSISLETREENIRVLLEGSAVDRESLINFSNKIENSGSFSEVNLPVSDLAKERNIIFSMSFVKNIKHEEQE